MTAAFTWWHAVLSIIIAILIIATIWVYRVVTAVQCNYVGRSEDDDNGNDD